MNITCGRESECSDINLFQLPRCRHSSQTEYDDENWFAFLVEIPRHDIFTIFLSVKEVFGKIVFLEFVEVVKCSCVPTLPFPAVENMFSNISRYQIIDVQIKCVLSLIVYSRMAFARLCLLII